MSEDGLLPIPGIGLCCPACGYNLTGLTEPRCPECGRAFDVAELFHTAADSQTDVRAALLARMFPDLGQEFEAYLRFLAGRVEVTLLSAVGLILQEWLDQTTDFAATPEDWRRALDRIRAARHPLIDLPRPPRQLFVDFAMPESDQVCAACGASLAGSQDAHCPGCRQTFDADELLSWATLIPLPGSVTAAGLQHTRFLSEGIPSIHTSQMHWMSISHGVSLLDSAVVRIPRAYFFDALDFLRCAPRPLADDRSDSDDEQADSNPRAGEWTCPQCREPVPVHFESCWNCGQNRP